MVSTFRLYLLRATYLMIFVFLTTSIWPAILHHTKPWSLMHGVACCLLAAMAPLVLLGLRYPLKMLPILFFELLWKSIWLVALGLPLWTSHQVDPDTYETMKACLFGVILFPIVIPWPYVFANFLKTPGDRWGRARNRDFQPQPSA
jgi:hypothetical protein